MKRMNKMLLVAALAATTLSAQAEQKKGPAWLSDALFYQIRIYEIRKMVVEGAFASRKNSRSGIFCRVSCD